MTPWCAAGTALKADAMDDPAAVTVLNAEPSNSHGALCRC
jgi:hypothetical protein